MFAVIRHYHFNPKDSAEIDRRVREQFVPIVKKAKGFVRYYWLDTGQGEGASVGALEQPGQRDHVGQRARLAVQAAAHRAALEAAAQRTVDAARRGAADAANACTGKSVN